jgi:hypothetical protein
VGGGRRWFQVGGDHREAAAGEVGGGVSVRRGLDEAVWSAAAPGRLEIA